jgi:putative endonuclease
MSWPTGVSAIQVKHSRCMQNTYYVYIMTSKRNGTLYIGLTNDLTRRALEHREGQARGFTKKYKVCLLVYYEAFNDIHDAIRRETQIKKYKREWKINLIQQNNVQWGNLTSSL